MDHPPEVQDLTTFDNEWIWGLPDTGKSYTARRENYPFFTKLHNKWWLGYQGESAVLYDDLSKTDAQWVGDFLKTWADLYAFPVETKFGGMMIRPKRIIVTSNYSIETLFGHDEELCAALKKRFKVRHFVEPFKPKEHWKVLPMNQQIYINDEGEQVIEILDEESLDLDDLSE